MVTDDDDDEIYIHIVLYTLLIECCLYHFEHQNLLSACSTASDNSIVWITNILQYNTYAVKLIITLKKMTEHTGPFHGFVAGSKAVYHRQRLLKTFAVQSC